MRTPPTGTITFLFTDIEGSTRYWEAYPDATRAAVAQHDALLRQTIEASNGYLVKSTGDGALAAFHTATDAIHAALAAQLAFQSEPWPEPITIRVRMALHTGTAEVRDGDYFGAALNRAARLMAAGHGGQTLVSDATQELVCDTLPPRVSLRSLGRHSLKDLARPEAVYQITHPELPDAFPALRSMNNAPNNLPKLLTSFIGREKPLADVASLLGKTRLLTLTGSGGSGKTRLALQAAADALDNYSDGVWLVELAPLADAALVGQTVALALGIKENKGLPLSQTLAESLGGKHLLLLLDNCEHVLSACTQLSAMLLRSCSQLTVLATSREPLGIGGEVTYRVPSLSLPDPKHEQSHKTILRFEAVRLFVDRAQSVRPDFVATTQNAPALAQVCRRLDGIPLAIELAAARARSLSVEDIDNRLDSRFRLLTGGDRSALPRQQTLRALVDWSYDLLNTQEKRLVSRLSVYAGGWMLGAAETVCGFDPIEPWEVMDLLTSLSDKSLVLAEEQDGAIRYRMLESLRQYSSEKLDGFAETTEVRRRHRDWCLRFALEAEKRLNGPDQAIWLSRLEDEHDNLRAALAGSLDDTDFESVEAGLYLSAALWRFWWVRGYLAEGTEHLARALGKARAAELPGLAKSIALAKALNGAGNLAWARGDQGMARVHHEEGLAIYREQEDKNGISASLGNLSIVACDQGDYEAARSMQEERLALCREQGRRSGIATSLLNLGTISYSLGDYVSAQAQYEESLAINRELSDKTGISLLLCNLGFVAYHQQDYRMAQSLQEESLALHRELGNKTGIALSLNGLGRTALRRGEATNARSLQWESLTLFGETGDRRGIVTALDSLAEISLSESDARTAAAQWGAADAVRATIGTPLTPNERPEYDRQLQEARSILGTADFAAAWEAGHVLTVEQAAHFTRAEAAVPAQQEQTDSLKP